MSENEFFNKMHEGAAERLKMEEAREVLAAEAEELNRATRRANRRRRAMLRTWRRVTVWLALIVLLVVGYTEGMVEPGLALTVGLMTTGLVGLEEVGA